jgi:hypothetical protein
MSEGSRSFKLTSLRNLSTNARTDARGVRQVLVVCYSTGAGIDTEIRRPVTMLEEISCVPAKGHAVQGCGSSAH